MHPIGLTFPLYVRFLSTLGYRCYMRFPYHELAYLEQWFSAFSLTAKRKENLEKIKLSELNEISYIIHKDILNYLHTQKIAFIQSIKLFDA